MKLRIHGVRGSRPVHKPQLLGYGGNSTCFEFDFDSDFHVFVDGGTGIVRRGFELTENSKNSKFYFLVTHTHWDHILGYPFFEPIYNPNNRCTFFASTTSKATFHDLFFGLQRGDNLPVPVSQIRANINFKSIKPAESFMIEDKIKVSTYQLNHQGVTLGYRLDYNGHSGAIITDNAPIENGNYLGEGMGNVRDRAIFENAFNAGLIEFLRDCHTVVYDTHFTEESLKPDWGHSTPDRAFAICEKAGVNRLLLFHHAPEDSDSDVDAKVTHIKPRADKAGMELAAATEGEIWLTRSA